MAVFRVFLIITNMLNNKSQQEEFNEEKTKIVDSLKKNYIPYYLKIERIIPSIPRLHFVLASFLVSAITHIILLAFMRLSNVEITSTLHLSFIMVTSTLSAALILLVNAYYKTISTLSCVLTLFKSKKQLDKFRFALGIMFNNTPQLWCQLGFCIFITGMCIWLAPSFSLFPRLLFIGYAGLTSFVLGSGLWLAVITLYFIHSLQHYGDLDLNILPIYTQSIRNLSRLVGTFSLSFGLETSITIATFLSVPWSNVGIDKLMKGFIIVPFIIFSLVFIFVPQASLGRIVKAKRNEYLLNLEKEMKNHKLFSDIDSEKVKQFNELVTLYEKYDKMDVLFFDFSTISKFTVSLVFPALFLLLDKYELFSSLFSKFIHLIQNP
ncbi:MAG: hypothetical protein HY279_10365 [Nitrospinae bacterium]|nr:hypothetical protein [Nitrospinota bacterium]